MGLMKSLDIGTIAVKNFEKNFDIIGDNLSNLNTTSFKQKRGEFATLFENTLLKSQAQGSEPVNPKQMGNGNILSAVSTDFSQGNLEHTGIKTDMAVEGEGFFVVDDGNGTKYYTRDGNFELAPIPSGSDYQTYLVSKSTGMIVQGIMADANGNFSITGNTVGESQLEGVRIPLGDTIDANATSNIQLIGTLNPGQIATTGTRTYSARLYQDALGTTPCTSSTNLANVYTSDGRLLMANGSSITISAKKGGKLIQNTFYYGVDGTTVQDLMNFLEDTLGIHSTSSDVPLSHSSDDGVADGDSVNEARVCFGASSTTTGTGADGTLDNTGTVLTSSGLAALGASVGDMVYLSGKGVTEGLYRIQAVNGNQFTLGFGGGYLDKASDESVSGVNWELNPSFIYINGNLGEKNDITDIELSSGTTTFTSFTPIVDADGESIMTTLSFYDSNGNIHNLVFRTTRISALNNNGSIWRWYADCEDDDNGSNDDDMAVGSGTVSFTNEGIFSSLSPDTISVDINNGGSIETISISLGLNDVYELSTEHPMLEEKEQDGYASGTMEDWAVREDGMVVGFYTNGQVRNIARIILATFINNDGLKEMQNNLYSISQNSGDPTYRIPTTGKAGKVRQEFLENSNVDLVKQFVNLIQSQRIFQANARVITTSDEMLQTVYGMYRG